LEKGEEEMEPLKMRDEKDWRRKKAKNGMMKNFLHNAKRDSFSMCFSAISNHLCMKRGFRGRACFIWNSISCIIDRNM